MTFERNHNSHCTSPEVFSVALGEHALVRDGYKVGALAPGGLGGLRASVNIHLRASVLKRGHSPTWLIRIVPDAVPVSSSCGNVAVERTIPCKQLHRPRVESLALRPDPHETHSPIGGFRPPFRRNYGPTAHVCTVGPLLSSRRGMRGETSLYVYRGRSWVSAYQPCAKARAKHRQTFAAKFSKSSRSKTAARNCRVTVSAGFAGLCGPRKHQHQSSSTPAFQNGRRGMSLPTSPTLPRLASSKLSTATKAGARWSGLCATANNPGG